MPTEFSTDDPTVVALMLAAVCTSRAWPTKRPFAQDGTDQPLIFAIVIDCAANSIDAARQGGVRDIPPAPNAGEKLVFGDHPVPVGKQKFQNIEDLRLQFDDTLAGAQLALVDIECEIVEDVITRSAGRPAIRASLSVAILFPFAGRDLPFTAA